MESIRQIKKVKVAGGGVSGLSCALALRQSGYEVEIVAAKFLTETTSAVAAAFWEPYHVLGIDQLWGKDSFYFFRTLLSNPSAGITTQTIFRPFESNADQKLWEKENPWHAMIPEIQYHQVPVDEVPHQFVCAVRYTVPVIHMPTYLSFLQKRAQELGVILTQRKIVTIAEELSDCDALVNCMGLGNRDVLDVNDIEMYPCRGQIVCVERLEDVKEGLFITTGKAYAHRPCYIIPRGPHDIVLGGTTDDDEECTTPSEAVTKEIFERCKFHYPMLAKARILTVKVGLRPARRGPVRFGLDQSFAKSVIHNYGHGGAGVTLSWGCALAVVQELSRTQVAKMES